MKLLLLNVIMRLGRQEGQKGKRAWSLIIYQRRGGGGHLVILYFFARSSRQVRQVRTGGESVRSRGSVSFAT